MSRLVRALVAFAACFAVLALAQAGAGESRSYRVIVNTGNPASSLDRALVADAFLKKVATWPSGGVIHPVDLPAASPVRRQFSEDVLRRSVFEVKGYWQQRIFSGRDVPPPELDNDDAVVEYVTTHVGAIGYVSAGASLHGAKEVAVR